VSSNQPFQVTGYHSCNKEIGLKVLLGETQLVASNNPWDWLGPGIYFWEENPDRALEYAINSAQGKQFNKIPIKTPFVIGTPIHLGNCLNLMEPEALTILKEAYKGLIKTLNEAGKKIPENNGANRVLDCAVLKYVHQTRRNRGELAYDTVRAAFQEGTEVYPTAPFTSQLHIQVCVLNPQMIRGYFLPLPHEKNNPYLNTVFSAS
jgi:hypothetical protein